MEYENFFALSILNDGKNWTSELSKKCDIEYNVLIMDTNIFEPRAFNISVDSIDNTDSFVVVLTDITKLTTKSKEFEYKATYDALTQVFNRNKFNDAFNKNFEIATKENKELCFAIFDIDFFKKVNDNHGHIIGDETLITFASTLNKLVRRMDTFARWGGEEFVLCLPDTNIDKAIQISNDLRIAIQDTHFKVVNNITCSIGITQLQENDTIDKILIRADEALYDAKEGGRNKVCVK
jgi:diguanylate cyclase (GGDEF)-like protein